MRKPKTLKNIEEPDYSIPRIMTPEDGDKGETKILEKKYILHVNSWELRNLIKAWIKFLEKESFKADTEYPRGHFQAQILREIFNIGD